jgi:hypothetical protein
MLRFSDGVVVGGVFVEAKPTWRLFARGGDLERAAARIPSMFAELRSRLPPKSSRRGSDGRPAGAIAIGGVHGNECTETRSDDAATWAWMTARVWSSMRVM